MNTFNKIKIKIKNLVKPILEKRSFIERHLDPFCIRFKNNGKLGILFSIDYGRILIHYVKLQEPYNLNSITFVHFEQIHFDKLSDIALDLCEKNMLKVLLENDIKEEV